MALIDKVTVSLSALPSPLTKENQVPLTVTANTSNLNVAADADRVEMNLQYVPRVDTHQTTGFNTDGLMPVKSALSFTVNDGTTGEYKATFAPSDFADPGAYMITVRAFTLVGGIVSVMEVAQSPVFYVKDQAGADQFNVLTDDEKAELDNGNLVTWKKVTFTGADLKAAPGVNTGTTKELVLASVPSGGILHGAIVDVNVADHGSASATTYTLGSDAGTRTQMMNNTDARSTGEARSFVPENAASLTLGMLFTVTGATINDISNDMSLTVRWGVAVPKSNFLGA